MTKHDYYITTDSGCDLQMPYCLSRQIVPLFMRYTLSGRECLDTMTEEACKEFYDSMRAGKTPATSQINPSDYLDFWRPLLSDGKPILHIALGAAISGTYSNALLARDTLLAEDPSVKIIVINSTVASAGYGLMCILAADMRDAGKSIDEVAAFLEKSCHSINAIYTTPELKYLHQGGRVSRTGAFLGGLLGINPILDLDAEGHLRVAEKVRGQQATLDRLFNMVRERVIDPEEQTVVISHSDCIDKANAFAERLVTELGFNGSFVTYIGPTIGSHTGPGLVSVFFIGKRRV